MTIEKVVTGSGEVDVTGSGYWPEGELVDGRPLEDPILLDEVRAVLVGKPANDAACEEDGEWTIQAIRPRPPSSSRRRRSRDCTRRARPASSARRRGAVHVGAQADEHGRARPRRRAGRRRRDQLPDVLLLALYVGTRRRRGASAQQSGSTSSPSSSSLPTRPCARAWRSPTGRCRTAPARSRTSRRAGARLPRRRGDHRPAAGGGGRRSPRRPRPGSGC